MIKISTVLFSTILSLSLSLYFSLSSMNAYAEQPNTQNISVKNMKKLAVQTISINKADAKLLVSLKGIGKKTAQAIIDYRKKNGKFKSVGELLKVKGVGLKFLEKNEKRLSI